jgi:hypothetical protein
MKNEVLIKSLFLSVLNMKSNRYRPSGIDGGKNELSQVIFVIENVSLT